MKGSVLVLGAGVAGMRAATELLQQGFKVCLLDEKPCIGGKMAIMDRLFPTNEHSACAMQPLMLELLNNPNVTILTSTELLSLQGMPGDFTVNVQGEKAGSTESSSNVEFTVGAVIVATGLGACLAMGVSGLFGTYITERAERKGHLKTLEESLLSDLNDSVHRDASEVVSVLAALIDGLSPSLTAMVALTPFFLTMTDVLIIWDAYLISFILNFATLFSLGVYLGTIAKENVWLYGFQMLGAGVVIAVVIFLFGGL